MIFGKKEPAFRPMKRTDIAKVVALINEHDEDDAEEAAESLHQSQEGMFVLEEGSAFSLEQSAGVFGVIGARSEPEVEDVVWLSWTYVAEERQRQGWGRMMMEQLIDMLRQHGIRKIFISTSDYVEYGEELYGAAKAFYRAMGAELELTVPDYHDKGEAQLIYGLSIAQDDQEQSEIEALDGTLEFYDVNPVSESEQGFALNWRMHEEVQSEIPDTLEQLKRYTKEGEEHGARILIATLPSDLSETVTDNFKEVGFQHIGYLKDYHCPKLHQEYWLKTF